MSKHTKAGRRASFQAYCDPKRKAPRGHGRRMPESLRRTFIRGLIRLGTMFVTGVVVDRMMGEA